MDGNCLPDQAIIGSGGVIRDHNSGWIAGFFSFENSGDYTKIEISNSYHGLSLLLRTKVSDVFGVRIALTITLMLLSSYQLLDFFKEIRLFLSIV